MRPEIRRQFKSKNSDKYLLPFSSATISTEFHMACKHLGIEDLRFHDLRHEGCTRLAEKRLYYSTDPAMQFARFMAKSATLCLIKEKPH